MAISRASITLSAPACAHSSSVAPAGGNRSSVDSADGCVVARAELERGHTEIYACEGLLPAGGQRRTYPNCAHESAMSTSWRLREHWGVLPVVFWHITRSLLLS